MISIVIPAHNEASVIGESLASLAETVSGNEAEIVVVCNGCTDETAIVVNRDFPQVKCVETKTPSKTNALNIGDQTVSSFPRFYIDADVILPSDSVERITDVLKQGDFMAASPRFNMDFSGASWAVRFYYEIWQQLPYVKEGMIGTGVYALSKEGRDRFDKFPEIIADDGYVRALFKSNERTVVEDCEVTVRAPLTLTDLIKIKTRSRLGVYQLHQRFPELVNNEEKPYGSALKVLLPKVNLWPKLAVYVVVSLLARLRAKKQLVNIENVTWERDESRRTGQV
jgi:glycosyltransferase involved in cell wall biosynthesis